MFDGAEGCLGAIRVVREQAAHHLLVDAAVVLSKADVLFLIHSLELGVEETQNEVGEAVALNLCPSFKLVGGNILDVHCIVVRGEGVGTLAADGSHRLVVLVGDGDSGSNAAQRVNLMIDRGATLVVGSLAINLVEALNLVEIDLFLLPVGGTQLVAALEEHMLQIVGQTGGLLGVVFRAGAHGDVGLDARGVLVDAEEDLQAVVEGVLPDIQRVIGIGLVGVLLLCKSRRAHNEHHGHETENKFYSFHRFILLFIKILIPFNGTLPICKYTKKSVFHHSHIKMIVSRVNGSPHTAPRLSPSETQKRLRHSPKIRHFRPKSAPLSLPVVRYMYAICTVFVRFGSVQIPYI